MKKRLVIVGPVPPPYHGCSVAIEGMLQSGLGNDFEITHLDTTDRRNLNNLGRWDARNIALALGSLLCLAWLSVTKRPAVVYIPISQNAAGFFRDGMMILVGAWLGGAHVVVHLHGSAFERFYRASRAPYRRFVDLAMGRVARGIVLGEGLRGEFHRWLPDARIDVVPNGIALPGLDPGRRASRAGAAFTVVFLGNLLKFKGVTVVIEAAAGVLKRVPTARFRFAGRWTDDPMYRESAETIRSECMDMVQHSVNPGAFEFLGELDRDRVAALLMESDVLVLPSKDEGLPMVILEAMAAGIPVISSKSVGAIPDVVRDGETGLLVPPGDPEALSAAILRLMEDAPLREAMGKAGRARYEGNYSMSAWTDRLRRALRAGRAAQGSEGTL